MNDVPSPPLQDGRRAAGADVRRLRQLPAPVITPRHADVLPPWSPTTQSVGSLAFAGPLSQPLFEKVGMNL